jgi:hypothetical protein
MGLGQVFNGSHMSWVKLRDPSSAINCELETSAEGFQRTVGELAPVVDRRSSSEESCRTF